MAGTCLLSQSSTVGRPLKLSSTSGLPRLTRSRSSVICSSGRSSEVRLWLSPLQLLPSPMAHTITSDWRAMSMASSCALAASTMGISCESPPSRSRADEVRLHPWLHSTLARPCTACSMASRSERYCSGLGWAMHHVPNREREATALGPMRAMVPCFLSGSTSPWFLSRTKVSAVKSRAVWRCSGVKRRVFCSLSVMLQCL